MVIFSSDLQFIRQNLVYQYSEPLLADKISLEKIRIISSRRTRKPRHIMINDNLFATVRARSGRLVLAEYGIRWLHAHLPAPKNRVIIQPDVLEFIQKGRSIFAKHVIQADPSIRPEEEVLIIVAPDRLIGLGRAQLSGRNMAGAKRGVAVKPLHILSDSITSQ